MYVYLNGAWRHESRACIPLDERGFQFGLGVFTTLAVQAGVPVFLAAHLARLERDTRFLGLVRPPAGDIVAALDAGLKRNRMRTGTVKIIVTADRGRTLHPPGRPGALYILFGPPRRAPAAIDLLVCPLQPSPWRAHKLTAYIDSARLASRARAAGCYDAVALAGDALLDTATANLFLLAGGELRTPPADGRLLPGIARQVLLTLPALRGRERRLSPGDLPGAEAVFLTNCARGIIPVRRVLDRHGRCIWRRSRTGSALEPVRASWRAAVREDRHHYCTAGR